MLSAFVMANSDRQLWCYRPFPAQAIPRVEVAASTSVPTWRASIQLLSLAWPVGRYGTIGKSRKWIQHLHLRFSEIVRVSGDDDEIVNERRGCDQTVLDRHRFTGLAQFSQK
jgi:hypothetical protein